LVVKYDTVVLDAHVAQEVEHLHGKQEVTGSNPVVGSKIIKETPGRVFLLKFYIIKEE
jgi:hypothetical protein